ncbi:MAG: TonB-dependent receptor [Phenylobacterium sp.]|nr:MAG: TonB-dependent receptor [Phenylobacterium sp.]
MANFCLYIESFFFLKIVLERTSAGGKRSARSFQGKRMSRNSKLLGCSAMVAALAFASGALAQTSTDEASVEEVVVTGSFIRGTPEDAALPVDVINADELQRKGSPTTVEMVKALTVSFGVMGDGSQYNNTGRGMIDEGRATVNLRGLGPERTLVLLNGRRMAVSDLNNMPQNAIARVELLKDGAAATYGSDAIGGVVNFITREDFDGVEVSADYRFIQDSDGQYGVGVLAGKRFDRGSILVSAGYQRRSDLASMDREWAIRPYNENPDGGWSGATSPTRFTPVGVNYQPTGAASVDVGCVPLGGIITADGLCRMQIARWNNIIDKETRYQLYAKGKYDLTDTLQVWGEALYAHSLNPSINSAASWPTTRAITDTVLPAGFGAGAPWMTPAPDVPDASNFFYVPGSNPGFAAYCAANPAQCPAGTTGAVIQIGQWRPFFASGNPLFDNKAATFRRERTQYRVAGGVSGETPEFGILGKIRWDANLSYSEDRGERLAYDVITGRLELALRGLGGAGCDFRTGTPGVGACKYFNPFSNAIASNPLLGLTNAGYSAAVANTDKELIKWFYQAADQVENKTRLWEGNIVFNGQSTIALPGGSVGYAFGGQWRRNYFAALPATLTSTAATPCADTPINGSTNCSPSPSNPFGFLGNINPVETERDVYALFGELSLPITEALNLQLAARFEDYGKFGGDTFNPKASIRWQVTDAVALRGSVGTTFRAPPQISLIPNTSVSLQNVFGTFRPVETAGNPNLTPEKALTYSVGMIVKEGNFTATVDYWNFKVEDVLTSEPLQSVVTAAFPAATSVASCSDPFISSHFTFAGPVCSGANISTVKISQINGPETRTSGVDFMADYRFDDVLGGSVRVGVALSYILKFDVDALVVNGVTFSPALDAVGYANFGNTFAYPMPQIKSEFYGEFARGMHNLRWTVRYTDEYTDQRTTNFVVAPSNTQVTPTPTSATTLTTAGKTIKAQVQHDIAYRALLPWDTTLSISVQNVFDKDPPFARTELSYDTINASPLGRTFQLGIRKRF